MNVKISWFGLISQNQTNLKYQTSNFLSLLISLVNFYSNDNSKDMLLNSFVNKKTNFRFYLKKFLYSLYAATTYPTAVIAKNTGDVFV